MTHPAARSTTPESLLEELIPLMAQAGSAGDATVLLLERLVTRRSCTAGWVGRLTPGGQLVGLAEVDVGIAPASLTIGADNATHPLWRAAMHPNEEPRVVPLRELGMEQAALVALNAIIGHTLNMLEGYYGPQNSPASGILRRIEQNSRHLLSLINDILDLSKIEAGQMPVSSEPVEVGALVDEVAQTLESMAERRELGLTVMRDRPVVVETDPVKLRQILINLGSNAIKFTTKGGVRIVVTRPGNGSRGAVIAVEDTGCGIPYEKIAEAFQDFRQLDQGYTRQEGGTGLGLPITRRLVGLLGGRLFVRSEPGVGSSFRVELPPQVASHPHRDIDVVVIEADPALARGDASPIRV